MPGFATGLRWTAGEVPYRGGGGCAVMMADMFGRWGGVECFGWRAVETRMGGLDVGVGARTMFQSKRGVGVREEWTAPK